MANINKKKKKALEQIEKDAEMAVHKWTVEHGKQKKLAPHVIMYDTKGMRMPDLIVPDAAPGVPQLRFYKRDDEALLREPRHLFGTVSDSEFGL